MGKTLNKIIFIIGFIFGIGCAFSFAAPACAFAAVCEVTTSDGQTVGFDTFNQGWAYTCYKSSSNKNTTTVFKLLSDWESWTSKGKHSMNGSNYSHSKYDLGVDVKRKDVPGLDDSKSKVDCFDDGFIWVPHDKSITIDLNGHNINRQRGNDQTDDGEVINVSSGAVLTIKDSNPNRQQTLYGYDVKGGAIMGGASEDGAGGIHIKNKATLIVEGCNICGNQTNDHGGAIKLEGKKSKLVMNNSTVFANKTRDAKSNTNGGAIYCDGGTATITKTTFIGNESEDYGGAIFSDEGNVNLTVTNCVFQNNYCRDSGGAIYMDAGKLEMSECEFLGNSSGDDGGGIYIDGEEGTVIRNCQFKSNYAKDSGGAIYVYDDYVSLLDCIIKNNSAGKDGGGIYVDGKYRISIQGVMEVCDNTASHGRADDLYLEDAKENATVYSGGLMDGSKVGIRTGGDDPKLKNVTKQEVEEYFFTNSGSFSSTKNSEKNESYYASVFAIGNRFVIVLVTILVAAFLVAGAVVVRRIRSR
ncbi:hypothetical protein [Eubacterium oxidoreducens]|uniref:Polymorphic outer membrane protein repeat-containing protein n=1 Tax=Eubacterium oxidoreducens TaxID=1732 RepID=A0A1G6AGE7_EUBOX|nr:hypothetical protein [Eubacterium oxidoreducens]SDB07420.1 polymorphic outer membrane protein repeat-containing protein [Eubacterium oxidoreducens]